MKIIIGLGNPGAEYAGTRHNAGIMLVEVLSAGGKRLSNYGWRRKKSIFMYETKGLVLVKTAGVFMNESGRMAGEVLGNRQWALGDLYIAHDDLDIRLGEYKIQLGKGPREHNGVLSVERALGTKEFWRVRIGVDNRGELSFAPQGGASEGRDYVLEKFLPAEKQVIERVLEKIAHELCA